MVATEVFVILMIVWAIWTRVLRETLKVQDPQLMLRLLPSSRVASEAERASIIAYNANALLEIKYPLQDRPESADTAHPYNLKAARADRLFLLSQRLHRRARVWAWWGL